MNLGESLAFLAAGFGAGAVNAMAGGGTLITFPVLVATGMAARTATITSAVGLLPGYAGGSVAYRRQLAGQGRRIAVLGVCSVIGATIGAIVLLVTSEAAFRVIVPYLIIVSCVLLALQPRIARAVARHRAVRSSAVTVAGEWGGITTAAVYGTYFGAGLGALFLAVLGIFIDEDLHRLNALKGVLSLIVSVVGVVVFIAFGAVEWAAAPWLAVGAWVGGAAGVRMALRLRPEVLRQAVVGLGLAVAVVMILR